LTGNLVYIRQNCGLLPVIATSDRVVVVYMLRDVINPLNAELDPICHLLALLIARHIFHVSGLRVKKSNFTVLSEELGEVKNHLSLRGIETQNFHLIPVNTPTRLFLPLLC